MLKTEPADNTTPQSWLNALLGTYAGLQLLNSFVAFNLLQESYGAWVPHVCTWDTQSFCACMCTNHITLVVLLFSKAVALLKRLCLRLHQAASLSAWPVDTVDSIVTCPAAALRSACTCMAPYVPMQRGQLKHCGSAL